MSKSNKTVMLVILLILPVLLFLSLNFFGKNYYNLLIYYPIDSTEVNGKWKVDYHTIPNFSLTNQENKPISQKDLKGKIFVADFIFTRCGNPTFCPKMSAELQRIQEKFAKDDNFKIVSFSIDPTFDTPEVLKKYAQKYEANPAQWYFLTGNKSMIYRLAYDGFKVTALQDSDKITPEFSHTNKVTLVDKEGRIRGYYSGNDRDDMDRLMLEIAILKYEYRNK